MEWGLDKGIAYGNQIDAFPKMQNDKYEGIQTRRAKDKRWNKLLASLSTMKTEFPDIFADKQLDKMITEYIDFSFVGSNICLYVELLNWFTPVDIQPTQYIDTGTYAPYITIRTTMTRLRENIANRIRDLQVEPSRRNQHKAAIGGLIGYAGRGTKVSHSHYKGKITVHGASEDVEVGGIIGRAEEDTEVVDTSADAEIEYKQD